MRRADREAFGQAVGGGVAAVALPVAGSMPQQAARGGQPQLAGAVAAHRQDLDGADAVLGAA
jgi:hypothetical protein